jgi:hypothetical protein
MPKSEALGLPSFRKNIDNKKKLLFEVKENKSLKARACLGISVQITQSSITKG